jgi:hypothetical protein
MRFPYRSVSSSDLASLSAGHAHGRFRHQRSVSSESIDYQTFLAQGGRPTPQLRRQPSRSSTWSQKTADGQTYTQQQFAKSAVNKGSFAASDMRAPSVNGQLPTVSRRVSYSAAPTGNERFSPPALFDEFAYIPVAGSNTFLYSEDSVPRGLRKQSCSLQKFNRSSAALRVGFRGEATIMEDVFSSYGSQQNSAPMRNLTGGVTA